MDFKKRFCWHYNLINDDIISAYARPVWKRVWKMPNIGLK